MLVILADLCPYFWADKLRPGVRIVGSALCVGKEWRKVLSPVYMEFGACDAGSASSWGSTLTLRPSVSGQDVETKNNGETRVAIGVHFQSDVFVLVHEQTLHARSGVDRSVVPLRTTLSQLDFSELMLVLVYRDRVFDSVSCLCLYCLEIEGLATSHLPP